MQHLGLLFTLAVLAVNLWGLMLIAGLYWRNRWFALVVGPILAVTLFFAIECQHGLGRSLSLLGLLSTALSLALIAFSVSRREPAFLNVRARAIVASWREEFAPIRLIGCFGVFGLIFFYALSWRFVFPDVDGSSEKIADFSYICSYYFGTTIPVQDAWYHPYLSTQYYNFQHYGAALMGRILMLPTGTDYNLAYCLLVALGGTAFSGAVFLVARKPWTRLIVILCFVVGGTGVTILDHFTDKNVTPWTNMRWIGSAQMDKPPLGPWLKAYNNKFMKQEGPTQAFPMELPGEIYSYVVFLGDYHAPLSAYYVLGLGAMGMLLWTRTRLRRYAVITGCTLTWTLLANTWILPLQGLLIFAWLFYNLRDWKLIPSVAMGASAVWLAAWPYLTAFTAAAAGYQTALRMVPGDEHTPPLLFLLFFLPTVAFIVLGFFSGKGHGVRLALLWLLLLMFVEYFYVDDEYTGHYDRFNTTLKWWPWVMAGCLMTLAPFLIDQAKHLWVRICAFIFCLYPCVYIYDLAQPMIHGSKESMGRIEGTYYLTKDEFPRLMLDRMKVEKPGVVIERPEEQGGFTNSAVIPLFAGQKMWLGWWGHELLWRGNSEDVRRRHDRLMLFYQGGVPDAGAWLVGQGIDYVLWYRPGDSPEMWEKVNKSIGPGYVWVDILTYQNEDGRRVGFWRRAPAKEK